jgi:O-antigen ligase
MTFFTTIVFIILVFWRPQEWLVPQLYGLPLLDTVVFLAFLALLLEVNYNKVRFPRGPVVYLLAGLWVASIISHVPHTYFAGAMMTITETGKMCLFTLLLMCVIDRPSRARAVAILFVAAATVMAVHALMQIQLGHGFGGQWPIYTINFRTGVPITRTLFYGIFSDPNDMAQTLATSLPLVFALPKRSSLAARVPCLILAGIILAGFFTTHSRGGMVALAAVITMAVVLKVPPRWFPYAVAVVLLGGIALTATKAGGFQDASAQERVVFWGMANEAFKHNPLFGIGYGMFWQIASDRAAHNAFVSCYTEMGIIGYWFWFGLLSLGVLGCWRARAALANPRTADEAFMRRFAGLSIVAVFGFCASAYFLSRAWVYPLFFLTALLNAVPPIAEDLRPECRPLIRIKRDVFVTNTLGSVGSVAYIYVSILLLNRAFY